MTSPVRLLVGLSQFPKRRKATFLYSYVGVLLKNQQFLSKHFRQYGGRQKKRAAALICPV